MTSDAETFPGLAPSVLDAAGRRLENDLEDADLPGGRRRFLEGLHRLHDEAPEEAVRAFRRAARTAEPPFDALARVARAECERIRGRVGVALREWRRVAERDEAPVPARYMAWLSIAAVADDRSDAELLERARTAIDDLETPEHG